MPAYCQCWEGAALGSCFPEDSIDIALETIGLVWSEGADVCFEADMPRLGSSFCTRSSCQVKLSSPRCTPVYAGEAAACTADDVVRFTVDETSAEGHCRVVPASVSCPDLGTWQDGHHCLCGIRRKTESLSAELSGTYNQRCCLRRYYPAMTQTSAVSQSANPAVRNVYCAVRKDGLRCCGHC